MLSGRSSLYVTSPRTFTILKLSFIIYINIIFMFGVLLRRYTLNFFFKSCFFNAFFISKYLYYSIKEKLIKPKFIL